MGAIVGFMILFGIGVVGMPVYCFFDWYLSKNGRGKITFKEYMKRI